MLSNHVIIFLAFLELLDTKEPERLTFLSLLNADPSNYLCDKLVRRMLKVPLQHDITHLKDATLGKLRHPATLSGYRVLRVAPHPFHAASGEPVPALGSFPLHYSPDWSDWPDDSQLTWLEASRMSTKKKFKWPKVKLSQGHSQIAPNLLTFLDEQGSSVLYLPNAFESLDGWKADDIFFELIKEVPWIRGKVEVSNSPGKLFWEPRLTSYYGDYAYRYSGRLMEPSKWSTAPKVLLLLKEAVEKILDLEFNSVLLNRYRNGTDSNGWHADNEPVYGENPEIASITFAPDIDPPRDFVMKELSSKQKLSIRLEHGSLLWMGGAMQHYWIHTIPKRKTVTGERINLTFRKVVAPLEDEDVLSLDAKVQTR
eukprot:gnl/MRDRNA2_/MRDRNA2_68819_c0_seq1.p1 gnl/MRDRNA2_/MRDRNA2_68819_c0~~gnl/MRDRNA2_/MRDRNA2_68819_c0_seq1.p1  ORF type:complete len:369 (-),score=51.40 gnl/MRDRNA2_/MRDRNA2_68819_c0_seq1:196-1302(-)